MKRAKLIVIEGTDGSGKETQSKKVLEYLINKKFKVKRFSFPVYDSPTGKIVGASYLGKPELGQSVFEETSANVDPIVSSLYYAADRRYNFLKEIEKEIYINDYIILDRYTMSNMGHQAGKAKTKKEKDKILDFIEKLEFDLCELPRPDIVIFLHMPYEATIELRKNRLSGDGNENNQAHLINAEKTYLYIAKKYNWKYINCIKTKKYNLPSDIKTIDEISLEIMDAIKNVNVENKISKMERYNE